MPSKTQRKLKATVNRCTYAYHWLNSHNLINLLLRNVAYEKLNLAIIFKNVRKINNVKNVSTSMQKNSSKCMEQFTNAARRRESHNP